MVGGYSRSQTKITALRSSQRHSVHLVSLRDLLGFLEQYDPSASTLYLICPWELNSPGDVVPLPYIDIHLIHSLTAKLELGEALTGPFLDYILRGSDGERNA